MAKDYQRIQIHDLRRGRHADRFRRRHHELPEGIAAEAGVSWMVKRRWAFTGGPLHATTLGCFQTISCPRLYGHRAKARPAGRGEIRRPSARCAKNWKGFPDSACGIGRACQDAQADCHDQCPALGFRIFREGTRHRRSFPPSRQMIPAPKSQTLPFSKCFRLCQNAKAIQKDDILHVAQSQYHDIGISRSLGMTNCWIERRHAQSGYGGTIEPENFTEPDYHFTSMAEILRWL